MSKRVIHLGNAGKGALECGAVAVGRTPASHPDSNWTWKLEKVTCKKRLKVRGTKP